MALTASQRLAQEPLPAVLPVTDRLRRLFADRLRMLPAPTRDLLLLSALQASEELAFLYQTVPDVDALTVLAPAERAGLVAISRNSHLVFRHPLVRSTLVELSPALQLRRAHRLLAETMADQPHRRAWHLAEAVAGPDEQVAELLEFVGRTCLTRGDAQGAVRALTRAAELSPQRSDQGRRLVEAAYIGATVT